MLDEHETLHRFPSRGQSCHLLRCCNLLPLPLPLSLSLSLSLSRSLATTCKQSGKRKERAFRNCSRTVTRKRCLPSTCAFRFERRSLVEAGHKRLKYSPICIRGRNVCAHAWRRALVHGYVKIRRRWRQFRVLRPRIALSRPSTHFDSLTNLQRRNNGAKGFPSDEQTIGRSFSKFVYLVLDAKKKLLISSCCLFLVARRNVIFIHGRIFSLTLSHFPSLARFSFFFLGDCTQIHREYSRSMFENGNVYRPRGQ